MQNFKAILIASSILLNFNQEHPSPSPKKKKLGFLVKSIYIWGFGNFSHRNARITKLWSYDGIYIMIWVTWWIFFGDAMGKNYDVIIFFQNTFILRISRIGNFANIIKTIFKKSKNVERTRNMSISVFRGTISDFRWKNADVSRTKVGLFFYNKHVYNKRTKKVTFTWQ